MSSTSQKRLLSNKSVRGVHNFSINRATCLATDWSKTGIGFTLSQKHCQCEGPADPGCGDGHWKLVYVGSRFLKDTETRYAPIEGEALPIAYALEKCKIFVLGCPDLTIATDHKPLVNIFYDRALETIHNPRLSQLKEKNSQILFQSRPCPWQVQPWTRLHVKVPHHRLYPSPY